MIIELRGGPNDGSRVEYPDSEKLLICHGATMAQGEFLAAHEPTDPISQIPYIEYAYVRDAEAPHLFNYIGERAK